MKQKFSALKNTMNLTEQLNMTFARVRINVFGTLKRACDGVAVDSSEILTMEQLRLPPVFRAICHHHKGLILVTGPTGSGKSTTMAAMVDYINKEMPSISSPLKTR